MKPCPGTRNCFEPARCHGLFTPMAAYTGNWFGDSNCRTMRGGCSSFASDTAADVRAGCIDFTPCFQLGTKTPTPPPSPCVCADIYQPVCVGGVTYSNPCEARCAGHTTWTNGECETRSPVSPPTIGVATDCPVGVAAVACIVAPCSVSSCPLAPRGSRCVNDYCGGCNANWYTPRGLRVNECTLAPTAAPTTGCVCPAVYAPVCAGGQTYGNACRASCGGHSRWTPGPCMTHAPTTAAPVTTAPTTDAPVTRAPTTHAPTTLPPGFSGTAIDRDVPRGVTATALTPSTSTVPEAEATASRTTDSDASSGANRGASASFAGMMVGVVLLVLVAVGALALVAVRRRQSPAHPAPSTTVAAVESGDLTWDSAATSTI